MKVHNCLLFMFVWVLTTCTNPPSSTSLTKSMLQGTWEMTEIEEVGGFCSTTPLTQPSDIFWTFKGDSLYKNDGSYTLHYVIIKEKAGTILKFNAGNGIEVGFLPMRIISLMTNELILSTDVSATGENLKFYYIYTFKRATTQPEKYRPSIKQGIYGTVIERYGDWMPYVGPENPDIRGERPIVRDVYVYEYTKTSEFDRMYYTGFPKDKMPQPLVAITTSDENGNYQIELEVGTYSVFLLEDNCMYANGSDGYGGIMPVTVVADSVSELLLVLDHAVY